MFRVVKPSLVFMLLLVLPSLCIPALGAPLTLEELMQLREQGATDPQVLKAVESRGLDFKVNLVIERKMRRGGFSRDLVNNLKRSLRNAVPTIEPPIPQPEAKPEEPKVAAKDPALEAEHLAFDKRLDRILKGSNTTLVKIPSEHITVVCEKGLADRFLTDVKKLEQQFAKDFPAPLGTGPDRRSAVIVITRTRYDYENYLESLFKVFKADGREFTSPGAEKRAIAASHIMLEGMVISCLENASVETSRHQLAYGVGFLYFDRVARGKAPVSMAAGFGNYAEVALMGRPSVRLTGGYSAVKANGAHDTWTNLAKQKFKDGKIDSLLQIMNYDPAAMQTEDYAVCWSFMTLLSSGEEQLAKLIARIRDGEQPQPVIEELYGLNEADFLARWKKFAMHQR